MTTSADCASLRKKIAAHMPALEQRARMRELAAVVREAVNRGDTTPGGFLRLYTEYAQLAIDRMARLDALRNAHAHANDDAERTSLIADELRHENAPRRAFAALRRGWLDLDAMAERAEMHRHALVVRQALALRAAAALTEERADRTTIHALLDLLLSDLPQYCAIAVAEALTELLIRLPEWPEAVDSDLRWLRVCDKVRDRELPRRVRAAIARLCLEAVPHLALDSLNMLLARIGGDDDFVLRQHVIVLLGRCHRDQAALALLTTHALRADSSEHVRLALPEALRAAGGTEALPLLEGLAGAREDDLLTRDDSPRVRAAAAIALAELLRDGEADTTAALAHLALETDPIVSRVVAEEIEDLAASRKLNAAQVEILGASLEQQREAVGDEHLGEPVRRTLEVLSTVSDPDLSAAEIELLPRLSMMPEGGIVYLRTQVAPTILGRLLMRLSRDGFGYNAWPVQDGYCVERGGHFVRRTWRILHELRNHSPYKRQDTLHSIGRELRGTLRAPSALLAEVTHTSVPGEPIASTTSNDWGSQIPTVDDLLSLPLLRQQQVTLFSGRGMTQIKPARSLAARLWTRLNLNFRYAKLAELRQSSLDPVDPSMRNRYLETLEEMDIDVKLKPYATAPRTSSGALMRPRQQPRSPSLPTSTWSAGAAAMLAMPAGLADFWHYMISPAENTMGQLGVAAACAGAYLLGRNLYQRERIRADRAAIPLCIGGWGTRGKSGTERLKAAMMHAQGVNVLTKTTGCEAMFIHGIPGRKPTEIFIHRSYDKATIWEQRDMLQLAARLKVDVYLWECMGLSGPLVKTLSEDWMRDDLQTLTNAYPDHEEIQGPAGHDVARSIAGFIRSGGTTITSEEQMLPILESEAKRRGARLISLGARDHLLLAEDLLARFPYREHPRNIALVRRLAVELGLDPDLATADMADHVVPDLGVLKAYPPAMYRGRKLIFVNGMSANERTGFMSNWQRTGCERPVDQQGRWVVTVVNNRFDRVARSQVFADILVRDATAERHVLIGTNLSGLRGYIDQALTHFLPELRIFRDDDPQVPAPALLEARFARLHHRLRIGAANAQSVLAELAGLVSKDKADALRGEVEAALSTAARWADADDTLFAIESKLSELPLSRSIASLRPDVGDELEKYMRRSIGRRALLASLERAAAGAISNAAARHALGTRQDHIYRELFLEMVVAVDDSGASGDQIVDTIARACPPGIEATVMGIQNIKGTGLDFVYRFIRYDEVYALVERLKNANAREARPIVDVLLTRSDYGILDSALAISAVTEAAARLSAEPTTAQYLRQAATRLEETSRRCLSAMQVGHVQRSTATRFVEQTFDTLDAIRRRWRADEILDALVHHEISHERAALEARRLVDREKKGWLRK